jgi:hypothetical protein
VLPDGSRNLRQPRRTVMAVTVEILRDLQQQAAGSCLACLHDNITANTSVLGDLIDIADNMAAVREESFENEELYQNAICEAISAILIIAVFAAELTKRPAPIATFTVSAN